MEEPKSAGPELVIKPDKANGSHTVEYTMEQPGCGASQDDKGGPGKVRQEQWEAQWQQFLKTLQPLHPEWGSPPETPESAPWEDAKAFLASFEQVAKACRWPRREWATRLLPALSGEADEAFRSLEARDREDYGKVKAAILRGAALRTEAERQHFRQFCCQQVEDPRRIHLQLQDLCHRWLKPEKRSKEQILELLVLEQFLASLPPKLQSWIRAGGPESCSQAVALAEEFLMASQQDLAEAAEWQGHLKEERMDSPGAIQDQIYEEAKQNDGGEIGVPGSAIQSSSHSHLLLSSGGHGMDQAGEREGPMALKETGVPLQIVKLSVTQPGPQTLVWEVLKQEEEEDGNGDFLDDGKGSEVKVENSPCGGNEPEDMPWTPPEISLGNGLEPSEIKEEGCRFKDGKNPVERGNECNELTEGPAVVISQTSTVGKRGGTALFSRYGRRYRYQSEHAMMQTVEDENEHPMSQEDVRQQQRTKRGERKAEFSWNRKGSGGKPYKCSHCGKCFRLSNYLKEHQLIHTGEKPHECSLCGKRFYQERVLRRHQNIHTGEKSYKCSHCGKRFTEAWNLKQHQRIHTGEKPHECSQCGKRFYREGDLRRHQNIHTGEKSYKCSHCGKRFRETWNLKSHQLLHTGEKPHECSQCGKRFYQERVLRRHQSVHTPKKLCKCSQCGRAFSRKVDLQRHQKVHTREESYKCFQCGECFSQSGALLEHQRTHTEVPQGLNVLTFVQKWLTGKQQDSA
ncbi:zinc finger protein 25 [Zootoca vivipara]|uniref:zinc finger protein 25 n=1 Tax=Zootoca vivipara TaxID=8524 RepID=UPI00293BBBC3|nr:zinc finger protein 25 [Zootoca vivipara]